MGYRIKSLLQPNLRKFLFFIILVAITLLVGFRLVPSSFCIQSNPLTTTLFYFLVPPALIPLAVNSPLGMIVGIILSIIWLYIVSCVIYQILPRHKIMVILFLLMAISGIFLPHVNMCHKPKLTLSAVHEWCSQECSQINQATTSEEYYSRIYDYCVQKVPFPKNSMVFLDNTTIYLGDQSIFCENSFRCINSKNYKCIINNTAITPELCRNVLCYLFARRNVTVSNLEDSVKAAMTPGDCNLTQAAHPELQEKTWWEMYFKNPNCSAVYQNAS